MEENKITNEELAEVKLIQTKFQECIFKFGNLQVEKMELDRMVNEYLDKDKKLKEEWENLQKMENTIIEKIIQKYGEVNLNIADGTFTPSSKS